MRKATVLDKAAWERLSTEVRLLLKEKYAVLFQIIPETLQDEIDDEEVDIILSTIWNFLEE
jgi:hypothetical protein